MNLKNKFLDLPIKYKIVLFTLLILVPTLVIGFGIVLADRYRGEKEDFDNRFNLILKLTAEHCVTPIAFSDKKGAAEILGKLNSIPEIKQAFLYDVSDNLFANVRLGYNLENIHSGNVPLNHQLIKTQVFFDGQNYGTLALLVYSGSINDRFFNYSFFILLLILILSVISFFLSIKLQNLLSSPIMLLVDVTKKISSELTYSFRFNSNRKDEIGLLYNGFDNMLNKISANEENQAKYRKALEESEKEKALILQTAPVSLGYLKDLKIVWANDSLLELINYTFDELDKKAFDSIFFNQEQYDQVIAKSMNAGELGGTGTHEVEFKSKSNKKIEVILGLTSMVQMDNSEIIIFTALDISERKKNQEIINYQLKVLEDKNKELEKYAYTVSHDLKTPIITIKGFLGSILNDIKLQNFDRLPKDIERVVNAANKMQELLSDLLEFSRAGTSVLVVEEFSVFDIVKDMYEMFRQRINEKRIDFRTYSDLPTVKGDKSAIRQVFQNLIENAIKFSIGNGNSFIEIGYFRKSGKVTLFVRDNGIGIESKYHSKIFNIFERVNPNREGTGIGLAIVQRIIEKHNGSIRVESEGENKGSTFYFNF